MQHLERSHRQPHKIANGLDPMRAMADEDSRISGYLRAAGYAVVLLVAGLGGWSATTQISGAVIAKATVVVESNSKSIQHLDGGVVRQIAIRDGQSVNAGDLLILLDAGRVGERMNGLQSQLRAKTEQLALMQRELEDLKTLEEKRLVPRKQVAAAKREQAELEGEIGRLQSELSRATTDKSQLELRAPISGRVHKLAVHTVGGVIAPGQEILQIVPSDAKLILEARIDPTRIDQVRETQSANIRLTSFNQRTTPELVGTVANVSADLVSDAQNQNFHYLARVALDDGQAARLGGKSLLPGMPADVFIQTDDRTILSYLLKPLTDHFQGAMREE
ncbi:MAG: HlyD family efflux transporter periplasmic adaptor subunit [Pseudomonadota bacterium]